jgi:hypothetical protein
MRRRRVVTGETISRKTLKEEKKRESVRILFTSKKVHTHHLYTEYSLSLSLSL